MAIIDQLLMGFGVALTPTNIMYCLGGAALGTLVGIFEHSVAAFAQQQAYAQQQAMAQPAQPAAQADDPIAKLKELAALKESGMLTDQEFTAAKAAPTKISLNLLRRRSRRRAGDASEHPRQMALVGKATR